ncbi:MAG: hypothetical protein ACPGWR_27515 [Ardenticatenaceae bacterium]
MKKKMRHSAEWLTLAEEILHEVVATYARYGAVCTPTLRIVLEGGPIPSYNIQKGQIEFYLPDPTTGVGRLCWLYYQNLCGAVDLYDTQATIESHLPLIIAHEVAHHLRFRYGVLAESQWREEEIVQLMAISLMAEHPRFAPLLERLEALTRRAAHRLAQIVQKRRQRHSEPVDRQMALSDISPQELVELPRLTPHMSFSEVILKAGLLSPEQLTNLTSSPRQMDMTDYGLAGTIWTLPHLERRDWPPLGQLIEEFILSEAPTPNTPRI